MDRRGIVFIPESMRSRPSNKSLYGEHFREKYKLKCQRKFHHSKGLSMSLELTVTSYSNSTFALMITLEIEDGVNQQCETFGDISRKVSSVYSTHINQRDLLEHCGEGNLN